MGVCCPFLLDPVLISRDLQVMRMFLFLFAVFFFLAPGKMSTFAGKIIGGGSPEIGSVSANTWAQSALDTLGPAALQGGLCYRRQLFSNAFAVNPLHFSLLSSLRYHRFEEIRICQERCLLMPSLRLTNKNKNLKKS